MPKPRPRASTPAEPPPDTPHAVFGRNVRATRLAQGRTQGELAAAAKLTHQYVSRVEDGQLNLTLTTMRRIAGALGMELPALLTAPPPG